MTAIPAPGAPPLSRRALLRTGATTVLGAAATAVLPGATHGASQSTPATGPATVSGAQGAEILFRALDAKIEAAMAQVQIPGVAVGVYYVTRVDETPMGFIVLPPRSPNPQ